MTTGFRPQDAIDTARDRWRSDVLPLLVEFARIPNLSPAFDAGWEEAGHMDRAADLVASWAAARDLPGATVEVVRLPGLTPTVLVDVPASDPSATGTVLLYGHIDKQPPFDGWAPGRGPWTPVVEGDRLYARGVADDGYALPSALRGRGGGAGRRGPPRPDRAPGRRIRGEREPTPAARCSPIWPTGSAHPTWCWRSTRAAPPMTGCG